MVEFINTEPDLTIEQIERLEQNLNLDFPIEYKNHLLKYNGGQYSIKTIGWI